MLGAVQVIVVFIRLKLLERRPLTSSKHLNTFLCELRSREDVRSNFYPLYMCWGVLPVQLTVLICSTLALLPRSQKSYSISGH